MLLPASVPCTISICSWVWGAYCPQRQPAAFTIHLQYMSKLVPCYLLDLASASSQTAPQAVQARRGELYKASGPARCKEEVEHAAWKLAWAAGHLQDPSLASFAGRALSLHAGRCYIMCCRSIGYLLSLQSLSPVRPTAVIC